MNNILRFCNLPCTRRNECFCAALDDIMEERKLRKHHHIRPAHTGEDCNQFTDMFNGEDVKQCAADLIKGRIQITQIYRYSVAFEDRKGYGLLFKRNETKTL